MSYPHYSVGRSRVCDCGISLAYNIILLPRPLSDDSRFILCIYRYSHASKRFVEVYFLTSFVKYVHAFAKHLTKMQPSVFYPE